MRARGSTRDAVGVRGASDIPEGGGGGSRGKPKERDSIIGKRLRIELLSSERERRKEKESEREKSSADESGELYQLSTLSHAGPRASFFRFAISPLVSDDICFTEFL